MSHSDLGMAVDVCNVTNPQGAKKVFTLFASGIASGWVLVLHKRF